MLKGLNKKEQQILEGIARSDAKTLKEVYQTYYAEIRNHILKNSGQEEDAEDIFQEALVVIFRKVQKGDLILTTTFGGYLFSICRYQWLVRLRKHAFVKENPIEMGRDYADLGEDLEKMIEDNERKGIYQRAFLRLPQNCQQILSGYVRKVKYEVIAQELNTTVGYIKKRKAVCQKKLVAWVARDPMYKELFPNKYPRQGVENYD